MNLVFVDGSARAVSAAQIARILLNRTGLKFVLLAAILATLVAPRGVPTAIPIWTVPLVKLGALGVFAGLFLLVLELATRMASFLHLRHLHEPAVTAVAVLPFTLLDKMCGALTDYCVTTYSFPTAYVWNLIFWQCITIIFFLFTPGFGNRTHDGRGATADVASAASIRIGSQDLLASEIDRIEVDDHLLRIICGSRSYLIHGALTDVAARLGSDYGVQLHRAHWVALRHVKAIETVNGKLAVRLNCGATLPVARGRRHEVEAALGRIGIRR